MSISSYGQQAGHILEVTSYCDYNCCLNLVKCWVVNSDLIYSNLLFTKKLDEKAEAQSYRFVVLVSESDLLPSLSAIKNFQKIAPVKLPARPRVKCRGCTQHPVGFNVC